MVQPVLPMVVLGRMAIAGGIFALQRDNFLGTVTTAGVCKTLDETQIFPEVQSAVAEIVEVPVEGMVEEVLEAVSVVLEFLEAWI